MNAVKSFAWQAWTRGGSGHRADLGLMIGHRD
jgi:hypothetical protein